MKGLARSAFDAFSLKARQALQDSSLPPESEDFFKIVQVLRFAQNDIFYSTDVTLRRWQLYCVKHVTLNECEGSCTKCF